MGSTTNSNRTIDRAAAVGHDMLLKNSFHTNRPIVNVCAPPNNSGITNSPNAGTNTNAEPAIIPGNANGIITEKNAVIGELPKSYAASMRD